MSKIVILRTKLGAPQLVGGLIDKVAVQNPPWADWLRRFDARPIIEECLVNAVKQLCRFPDIKAAATIEDYFGNSYENKLIGAVKSEKLPRGLGIKLDCQGIIEFVGDDYESSWKAEIKRLQKLFTDAFLAEATSAILQIIGMDTEIQMTKLETGEVVFLVEGTEASCPAEFSGNRIYAEGSRRFRLTRSGERAYLVEGVCL